MLEKLELKEWLALNAKLQTKKNKLRALLKEKGVLKKEGNNTFDRYKYFTEAQYKELFTELFSDCQLELKFTELEYVTFEGTEKQANGRMPRLEFKLLDCETGFYEETIITGEGIDKGDKAGYKAYTGALKYYLANTFMVATGDDPETESPDSKMNDKKPTKTQNKAQNKPISASSQQEPITLATPEQLAILNRQDEPVKAFALKKFSVTTLESLSAEQAAYIIKSMSEKGTLK